MLGKKPYHVTTIGSAFRDVYVFSKQFKVKKDPSSKTGEYECFAFGTKIELDDILFEIGGGATNAAYTFRRQGLRTACISRVGDDAAGKEVLAWLKKKKIKDCLQTDAKRRTAHSVVFLAEKGERTILVYRGASHHFNASVIDTKQIQRSKWLYITSMAGNIKLLKKILQHASAHGVRTMVNPGRRELRLSKKELKNIFQEVSILLLNREEARMLAQTKTTSDAQLIKAVRSYCPGIVIITKGAKGSVIGTPKNKYTIGVKPVQAVDSTGAGDAFGSGFLAGYIRSKGNIPQAITLASNNAAAVIKKIGAKHGLLSKHDKLKKVNINSK